MDVCIMESDNNTNYRTIRQKLLSFLSLCTALLIIQAAVLPAFAVSSTDTPDINGSMTAFPNELSIDNRNTTVTLSLPSAQDEVIFDVVFVIDKSNSTATLNFDDKAGALLDNLLERNASVRVGIVKYAGTAVDQLGTGLTLVTESNIQAIKDDMNAPIKEKISGSNLHAGLVMADEMLANDTDVPDDRKYVIIFTDGKNRQWINSEGKSVRTFTQYYSKYVIQNNGTPTENQNSFYDIYGKYYNISPAVFTEDHPLVYFGNFMELFNSSNPELSDAYTEYDYESGVDDLPGTVTVTNHSVANSGSLPSGYKNYYEVSNAGDFRYYKANPFNVTENDGEYSFNYDEINPEFYMFHVRNMEKADYLAAHKYADMSQNYHMAAAYDISGTSATGISTIGRGFCTEFLADTKDVNKTGVAASEYAADMADIESLEKMFDSIEAKILYMVDSGVLTDEIPDDFSLVIPDDGCPFTVSVDDTELATSKESENVWNFGELVDLDGDGTPESYPYSISYTPASGDAKAFFTQTINVPVENARPVKIAYDLEIDESSENGSYPVADAAYLDYFRTADSSSQLTGSAEKKYDGRYEFDIPSVTYGTVITFTITSGSSI